MPFLYISCHAILLNKDWQANTLREVKKYQPMTIQTLSVREAGGQLQNLVDQARNTHHPVILTSDDTAEPVALLVDPSRYEQPDANPETLLNKRLGKVSELLDLLADRWDIDVIRRAFPGSWRWHLEGVWEASHHRETTFRQLTILSQMATDGFDMADFTREHLTVLQQCLHVLCQSQVSENNLIDCDDALSQAGFSILLNFDDDMVALYVDES